MVFGEIIPQALCGRHPLWTGAKSIGLTWFFYVVLWPVAYVGFDSFLVGGG